MMSDEMDKIDIRCPECGADLDGESKDEANRVSWICRDCNIKIYKELY